MLDEDSPSDDDDQLDIPNNTKRIASIRLGQTNIDCWFHSPYLDSTENTRTIDRLFICEYCLRYFFDQNKYHQHTNQCTCRQPPGRKVYEDPNGLAVYEIDGSSSELYCQCLCLLAKLFLERKTIYFDVNPFLFYILTENDKRTKNFQHIIGYFSKEKSSEESCNLACLMVLPHYQRQGFGKFLISLSYELTKLEKKTGSPERPLSALGQMTYKSYWQSAILSKLDEYRRVQAHPTIEQLSIDTGICLDDVIQTLIDLRIAYTGEVNNRQYRRRQRSTSEHDDSSISQSVLTIDQDLLHSTLVRFNLPSKVSQKNFYSKYLRWNNRRDK